MLKRSRPRTSDTAIWVSLIVAGPYFLALLSGACHLVSCCVAQQLDSNNSVDLPRGPSVVAYIYLLQLSLRSKRFQSTYCVKILKSRPKKKEEGGGGGEKRKRLHANPTILENAP